MRDEWEIHCDKDKIDENLNNPMLFPSMLPVDEMKNLPPTIIMYAEFDWAMRDSHTLIPKLKEAGVYLDHMFYSGSAHCFNMDLDEPKTEICFADQKQMFAEYILK